MCRADGYRPAGGGERGRDVYRHGGSVRLKRSVQAGYESKDGKCIWVSDGRGLWCKVFDPVLVSGVAGCRGGGGCVFESHYCSRVRRLW